MIHSIVESPIGDLLLVGDGRSLRALYTAEHVRLPETTGDRSDRAFTAARTQLAEYFAGVRQEFDLPLAPRGTGFQRRVWDAVSAVPFGATASYAEIAAAIGTPSACRAVGAANGRNPLPVIVPCHRVVGSTGALTGYGGGLERKRALLDLEAHGG
jgi:methylated-DNA-[protein]-cysteine S-methyltransferase